MAVNYTIDGLKRLWTDNGGNPQYQNVAAYVAYAISQGNADHQGGIWGIDSQKSDPDQSARNAISKSGNGTDWTTWNLGSLQAQAINLLSNLPGASYLETIRVNDVPANVTSPGSWIQKITGGLGLSSLSSNLLMTGLYITLIPFGLIVMFIGFVIAWVGTGVPKAIAQTGLQVVGAARGLQRPQMNSSTTNTSNTNILSLTGGAPTPPEAPTQLLPVTPPPPPPQPAGWGYAPREYGSRPTGALYMADDLFGEEAEMGLPDFALPRSLLGNMFNEGNASRASGDRGRSEAEQAAWRASRAKFWRENRYKGYEPKHALPWELGGSTERE